MHAVLKVTAGLCSMQAPASVLDSGMKVASPSWTEDVFLNLAAVLTKGRGGRCPGIDPDINYLKSRNCAFRYKITPYIWLTVVEAFVCVDNALQREAV